MNTQYKFTVMIVTLAVACNACRRSSTNNKADSPSDVIIATDSAKTAKWTMPEDMMQHMRNLEQDVRAMDSLPQKDHATLAAKIDAHTKQLIASCTMDGKSHEVLHDWLMPFLKLNKEYAAATEEEARSAKFKQIKESLAVFHDQFE